MPGLTPHLAVVVAHPDDETFGCGSLLLHATAAGFSTSVLCATRGEAGESVDGTPAGRLAAVREAETRSAADVLGVDRVEFLDYADSGMSGDVDPDALVGAPLSAVTAAVRGHLDTVRPTVVVTLDGSDGHRDHARIRDATLAAVADDPVVDRVYLHCLPQRLMRRWIEHMAATDPTSWEHLRSSPPGTPEEDVTTELDTTQHLARRERAMACHASQRSPYDGLPPDLRRAFLTTESLRRVRPSWTGGAPETRLTP